MADERAPLPPGQPDHSRPSRQVSPPSSPGLPPSDRKRDRIGRLQGQHPAARKAQLQKTEDILATAQLVLEGVPLPAAAIRHEVAVDSQPVKELVRAAKERFLRRVDEYLDAHVAATQVAALKGNAEPAQWALERIQFEGERVIDPVDERAGSQVAGMRIGVLIGGIPQQATQTLDATTVTAADLPPMEEKPPEELMP